MIWIKICVFICVVVRLSNCHNFTEPTDEETKRGFSNIPYESWGQQLREENSIRILCIGGSNTAGVGPITYMYLFSDFLRDKYNNFGSNTSYVIQRAYPGLTPEKATGMP